MPGSLEASCNSAAAAMDIYTHATLAGDEVLLSTRNADGKSAAASMITTVTGAPHSQVVFSPLDTRAGASSGSPSDADLLEVLRRNEVAKAVEPYMHRQVEISPAMRAILMDWLVEVSDEYHLQQETLHLAVGYVDRFLSQSVIERALLQLVGVTALFIAAKFEELEPPPIDDFVDVTANTYTRDQIIALEAIMLSSLHYDLVLTTSQPFIHYIAQAASLGEAVRLLAVYYAEWTVQDYAFASVLPSKVACCAVALALQTNACKPWLGVFESAFGYSSKDLLPCMRNLCRLIGDIRRSNLCGVYDKFAHTKQWRAVATGPVWLPGDRVPFE